VHVCELERRQCRDFAVILSPRGRFLAKRRLVPPASASCGRGSALVPDMAAEVVGEIGHADLRPGSPDALGPGSSPAAPA
jgi:hypothetical protein